MAKEKQFKVTAIKRGFIHGRLMSPGDEFTCTQGQFSKNWMKKGKAEIEAIDNSGIKKAEDVKFPKLEIPEFKEAE